MEITTTGTMARERAHRHTMRPILRRLHSPDLPDMQNLLPDNSSSSCILVQAMIGPEDEMGEESFDFLVCTNDFIANSVRQHGFLFGKNYLVIANYHYQTIWNAIELLCGQISGSSWKELAEKLGRYGKWEFEDYIE
jgi:Immunity protein 8